MNIQLLSYCHNISFLSHDEDLLKNHLLRLMKYNVMEPILKVALTL